LLFPLRRYRRIAVPDFAIVRLELDFAAGTKERSIDRRPDALLFVAHRTSRSGRRCGGCCWFVTHRGPLISETIRFSDPVGVRSAESAIAAAARNS
jgi:hypothetical protein